MFRRAMAFSGVLVALTLLLVPAAAHGSPAITVQRLGYCGGDDWEPTVAASAGGHVYVLITHYAGSTGCDPASGTNNSRIMIQVSTDDGQTFSAPQVVSATPGGISYPEQADPSIAVDPKSGAVYVAFLAYGVSGGHTDVYVARSTDHGVTFPRVVKVNHKNFRGITGCKNCDHEKILAYAGNVYVAYGQAQYHYVAVSHDGGASFVQHVVDSTYVVSFAEAAALDSRGNAWFAWGDCETSNCTGSPAVDYRVSETPAGNGATTFSPVIANAPQAPDCPFSHCGFSYLSGQDALAIDGGGTMYLVWQDGQVHTQKKSPPIINLSRCSASCLSTGSWRFVGRADDKDAGPAPNNCGGTVAAGSARCYALFPNITAGAPGRIFVTWMDDRNGGSPPPGYRAYDHMNGWNLWLRASTDGGASWTTAGRRLSDLTPDPTQSQEYPNGFLFPYGDYDGLVLDPGCASRPVTTWGEGHDWVGGAATPGHIEFASLC